MHRESSVSALSVKHIYENNQGGAKRVEQPEASPYQTTPGGEIQEKDKVSYLTSSSQLGGTEICG